MVSKRILPEKRFPVIIFVIILFVTLALFLSAGWNYWHSYKVKGGYPLSASSFHANILELEPSRKDVSMIFDIPYIIGYVAFGAICGSVIKICMPFRLGSGYLR